jgi:dihydrofolate reductase
MNTEPRITAIFATDTAGGLGFQGSMPWPRLTADMHLFRSLTLQGMVIMGRHTWDSDMPTPLPSRLNLVITRRELPLSAAESRWVLRMDGGPERIISQVLSQSPSAYAINPAICNWWVIGGANILRQWLPFCQSVVHNEIQQTWSADTFFRPEEWQSDFESRQTLYVSGAQDPVPYRITQYTRRTWNNNT